jgi:peptidoglycan/xylan/chitin deacetylase (PgdA/CDA1 family)
MPKEIFVAYGVDVDSVAGWISTYGGEDSPCDISRGVFAGEVGTPRLLRMFERWGIRTTWFIPGHSIETFPEQMAAVARGRHEIGLHGYTHENPLAMSVEQEEAVLDKSIELITDLAGARPRGYVAPWWEYSSNTVDMLLKKGISYDHSLMHNDFHPYYARTGESWTKVDYRQPASSSLRWFEISSYQPTSGSQPHLSRSIVTSQSEAPFMTHYPRTTQRKVSDLTRWEIRLRYDRL